MPTEFLIEDEDLAWLLWLGLLAVFPVISLVLWLAGRREALRTVALLSAAVFTVALVSNALWLIWTLTERRGAEAYDLLWDAGIVWSSNVLVFTVWYWLIDAGGPERRNRGVARPRDFVFPLQATEAPDYPNWRPNFIDYLFLSFCSCTAFSPADTFTASRRAKLLQMFQASLSLIVLAMIAARAINIIEASATPTAGDAAQAVAHFDMLLGGS